MATFLDVTLLGSAKIIFTFLLVYVIIWGMLTWIKPFGKEAGTGSYAIIALVAAFFSILSSVVRDLIEFITPWFLILILVIFFLLFTVRMFGLGEDSLVSIISHGPVHVTIITIVVLIVLFGLGTAFGQTSLEATQGESGGQVFYQGEGAYGSIGGENGEQGVLQPVAPLEPGQNIDPRVGGGGAPQPGQAGATNTGNFSLNLINTLLHPKVMAIVAMILIGVFTVLLMSRGEFIV